MANDQFLGYGKQATAAGMKAVTQPVLAQANNPVAKATSAPAKTTSQKRGWSRQIDFFDTNDLKKGLLEKILKEPSLILPFTDPLLNVVSVSAATKIYDEKSFISHFRQYTGSEPTGVGGYTDKLKGEIYLRGNNQLQTRIEYAIHEAIHLLAHPAGAANKKWGDFRSVFGPILDEGLTSYYTETVMSAQGFADFIAGGHKSSKNLIYDLKLILEINGIGLNDCMGDAYFEGKTRAAWDSIKKIFGTHFADFITASRSDESKLQKLFQQVLSTLLKKPGRK